MSVCWITSSIIVCGVSDRNDWETSSLIFFNTNDLKSDHAIQTVTITIAGDARIMDMRCMNDWLFVLLAGEQMLIYHIENCYFFHFS